MLRDDAFIKPRPNGDARWSRDALRGVGDPAFREAMDQLGVGPDVAPTRDDWAVGDTVEYTTPDARVRTGAVCRKYDDSQWLIKIDDNTYNVVPATRLRAATRLDQAETIRDAVRGRSTLSEARSATQLNDTDFTLSLDYGASSKPPTDDALRAYVASEHAARVLDAEIVRPGLITVVCTKQAESLPEPRPKHDSSDPPFEEEEIEGTGKIGALLDACKQFADCNSKFAISLGAITEDDSAASVGFELKTASGDKLYLTSEGNVTPVLAEDVTPAVGYISYDGSKLTGGLHGPDGESALPQFGLLAAGVEPPYSSGTGAQTIREDYPGSDDYVVKADAETETETIAGPGEVTAVDKTTKDYWQKYYRGGYGKRLTERKPRRKHRADVVIEAWQAEHNREPTQDELVRVLAVLYSKRTAQDAWPTSKTAQAMTMRDYIQNVLKAVQDDSRLGLSVDKMMSRYITKNNPKQLLDQLDETIYPRLLYGMLQHPDYSKKLRGLVSAADVEMPVSFGKPEDFKAEPAAPAEQPAPDDGEELDLGLEPDAEPEEAHHSAHKKLMQMGGDYPKMPPDMQLAIRREYIQNPAKYQRQQPEGMKMPAYTAGRQPAMADMYYAMCPRIEQLTADGSYMHVTIVWDPEGATGMSPGNVRQTLITFVKGEASKKEYKDLGTIGKPRFKSFDPSAGMAELLVRSSEGVNQPQRVVDSDGKDHDASA